MKRSIVLRLAAVTAAVGIGAIGLAPLASADNGVFPKRVVIGTTTPLSGPASAGYMYIPQAAAAYFAYLNKSGGVNGRTVDFKIKDDKYSPALTGPATSELLLNDQAFAIFGALGTDTHNTVVDVLNKQKVPDLFPNTGSPSFANVGKYPYTIPYLPSYTVEAKAMAKYIQDTAALSGMKRCFFYQDGEFGAGASDGFKAAGMDFALTTSYAAATVAQPFAAQVVKMKAAGCQLVVFFGITQATANLLGTSAKVGFKPTWMVTSVGTEPTIIKSILGPAATPLMTGVYTASFLTPITDVGNPYVAQMKTLVEASGLPWNFYTFYGVNTAYVMAQALKAAGPNLTREGLIQAVQTKGSTFRSAAVVPFVVSASSHQGLTGYWIGQYDAAGTLGRLTKGVYVATNNPSNTAKLTTYTQVGPTPKLLP